MGKYTFKPYNPIFSELFSKEKARIAPYLSSSASIEHVGSTAVPGLGGKGIIDIAVAVDKSEIEMAKTQLQELKYEFRPAYSMPDRLYFIIYLPDPEEGTRRYHIHLTYPESKEWKELIGFRDFLLSNPDALYEYAELKKKAATEASQDGNTYRKMKEPMFQKFNALQSTLKLFAQKDFDIEDVLCKPLMAHLSTVEKGVPRDSPVWFLWEESCLWIFGTSDDSFVKRLLVEPQCASGIVEYDLEKGILKHVGIRGTAVLASYDKERLIRFVSKYLGNDKENWNPWFIANIVDPLDIMIKIIPQSIVAKNVSFFKTGPDLAS